MNKKELHSKLDEPIHKLNVTRSVIFKLKQQNIIFVGDLINIKDMTAATEHMWNVTVLASLDLTIGMDTQGWQRPEDDELFPLI